MVYNTGLNSNYYNDYFYNQYLQQKTGVNPQATQTIGLTPQQQPQQAEAPKANKYEADDGKISFGSKVKNFFKGVGKFFTGLVTDENGKFSLGKTLKTALTAVAIGAVCVLTAGTAVPALIAAGAVAGSAVGLAKGAIRAASATTDAEAEAAWQSIGGSTTGLALSVVGARAVAKGSGATIDKGIRGYGQGIKHVFKTSKDAAVNSFQGVKTAWQSEAGMGTVAKLKAVKTEVWEKQGGNFAKTIKTNYNNSVSGIKNKITKESESLNEKKATYEQRANNAKTNKERELWNKKAENTQRQIDARDKINNTNSYEEAQNIIESKQTQIREKAEALKTATGDEAKAIKQEIKQLEKECSIQTKTLARKTEETNVIESKIASKQEQLKKLDMSKPENATQAAKLQNEIAELESQVSFKTTRTQLRENGQTVADLQAELKARQDFLKELKENNASEADIQAASNSVQEIQSQLNGTRGNVYTNSVKEILIDAKNSPSANWLTLKAAGREEHYPTLTPEQIMLLQQYGYVA